MRPLTSICATSTQFCWICGRGISGQNCEIDEHGSIVHAGCYTVRKKLKEAAASTQRQQSRMQLLRLWLMRLASTW